MSIFYLEIFRQADGQTAGRTDERRLRLAARRQAGGKCRRELVGGEDGRGGPAVVRARWRKAQSVSLSLNTVLTSWAVLTDNG